jgi:3-oxoacyl-[acyl-carrier protein] reductase
LISYLRVPATDGISGGARERYERIRATATGEDDGSPGFVGEVSYGASKFAPESLSRAAALELGPLGIRVNVVAPGPIQTGYISPDDEARIAQATPLRRIGTPDDVADVVRSLCTDHTRWLTGQILYVGGGWRVW